MAQEIGAWLASLGMTAYVNCFTENDIDLEVLPELTDHDLEKLGVSLGHRRKILRAIRELTTPPSVTALVAPVAPTKEEPQQRDTAERRQLTVMFCDLVGSTALSERMDPEDLRVVIGHYHRCCAELVERNGGFIAKYMGDGVLAYFGYPRAQEHDAERAVRAGLALVEAVPKLDTSAEVHLQVRVGIATGLVIVGDLVGSGAAQEQAVVGETPNLAARLQAVADPGSVVISASTRRLTGGFFKYRELGRIPVKGLTQPVSAWQLLDTSGVESRFEAHHETSLTPLLGRDEEMEQLSRRWQQAVMGDGRVVLLTGEPGIGKSHIALALQERLQAEPHIRLRYFCSPHHTNSAFFPFIDQLERAARLERGDALANKYAKLEAVLAQSSNDVRLATALLANMLSLPDDERYPLTELTPQKRKESTLEVLLSMMAGLSAKQPVLVARFNQFERIW